MTAERQGTPRLPPRLIVRAAWVVHRAIYRFSRGQRGLWRPKADAFGTKATNGSTAMRSGPPPGPPRKKKKKTGRRR